MIAAVAGEAAIAARIEQVRARVEAAAARAGRDPADITVVAASKTHPVSMIEAAVAAGVTDIGENRVQEWREKRDVLAAEGAGDIRWHLIGTLQKNKVRAVAGEVSLIHSVDSLGLAETIAAHAHRRGAAQDVLLEVNVSGEASKHGVARDEAEALADRVAEMDGLRLRGFMTIPPAGDQAASHRAFAWLRELRDRLAARHPEATELSMGMSGDFEIGIEEGSTLVRIGTAIFGPREA